MKSYDYEIEYSSGIGSPYKQWIIRFEDLDLLSVFNQTFKDSILAETGLKIERKWSSIEMVTEENIDYSWYIEALIKDIITDMKNLDNIFELECTTCPEEEK